MHIFLDNFQQGGKYIPQIEIHQEELRREENVTDQIYLYISSLHNDYLNIDNSSGYGRNNKKEKIVQKNALFVEVLTNQKIIKKKIRKEK